MAEKITITSDVSLYARERNTKMAPEQDTPFCIGILGDFSSQNNNSDGKAAFPHNKDIIEIDRDNIDEIIRSCGITLRLNITNNSSDTIDIPVSEIDDFDPDNLIRNTPSLNRLYQLRSRLLNNATFSDAANELRGILGIDISNNQDFSESSEAISPPSTTAAKKPENLLDMVLTQSETSDYQVTPSTGSDLADNIIKSIISKHIIPAADPKQADLLESVEQIISGLLRNILHDPCFQQAESTWRAISFLTRRLETGHNLRIYLINLPKQQILNDFQSSDFYNSRCINLLKDSFSKGVHWSLFLANYVFDTDTRDINVLTALGKIAQVFNTSVISSAHSNLVHCDSFGDAGDPDDWVRPTDPDFNEAWEILRNRPEAGHIALVQPRFILRMPYGNRTNRIDSFDFEEMLSPHQHEHCLWSNPAFLICYLLAKSFEISGWDMHPGEQYQVDNLPLYQYDEDGESVLLPCAEFIMTERAALKIQEAGIIPLWSIPNRDSVKAGSFRSLSNENTALKGPWASPE